jgi:hypothetical protein
VEKIMLRARVREERMVVGRGRNKIEREKKAVELIKKTVTTLDR